MYDRRCARCSRSCLNFCSSYTPLIPETEPNTRRTSTVQQLSELLTLAFSDTSLRSPLPNPTEQVCLIFEHPVSRVEVMLRPGKQKYATTVYHVIWAELSVDMLTVSFVEKKTQTVCIRARLWGSGREAVQWVEDSLNITYKGAIPTLSL